MTAICTDSQTEVLLYTQALCEALEVDYRLYSTRSHRASVTNEINSNYHQKCLKEIADGTYDFGYQFVIETGKKYHKVIMIAHGNRSVHCFVDKKTGSVLKSASWKAPAKGERCNLLIPEQREWAFSNADWSGAWLYRR